MADFEMVRYRLDGSKIEITRVVENIEKLK